MAGKLKTFEIDGIELDAEQEKACNLIADLGLTQLEAIQMAFKFGLVNAQDDFIY